MPFHYVIETDGLYLEGKEIGIEQAKYEIVARLLRQGQLSKEMIASAADVDLAFVLQVERDLLNGNKN